MSGISTPTLVSSLSNGSESEAVQRARREYARFEIRRRVRRDDVLPDGVVTFKTYSFTRSGQEIVHHLQVDTQGGAVECDCEDFRFRRAPQARRNGGFANVMQPECWCKHIERAINNLVEHGELRIEKTTTVLPAAPTAPARAMTALEKMQAADIL